MKRFKESKRVNEEMTMETDVITPLLKEFEGMRNTISGMIGLIKKQQEQNDALKKRVEALEAIKPNESLPAGTGAAMKRLMSSSRNNRELNEAPERLALAAHLIQIKNFPSTWVTKCGLLTQSKTQGLIKWEQQHMLDFFEVSGVMDVFRNGMTDEAMMDALPTEVYDGVKQIMAHRAKKDA